MILDFDRVPILETERLRLEPLTQADAALLYPILGDAEIVAFWDTPDVDDPDMVGDLIRGQIDAMNGGQAIHWVMRPLDGAPVVGGFELSQIDRRHRRAEVGFVLARTASGLGYEAEVLPAVVAFAAASGLRKLAARTHLGDRSSETVLESMGFTEEGLLRGHILKAGERRDCRLFGLLL